MDRYKIALKKHNEYKEPEKIQTFGFDNEVEDIQQRSRRRRIKKIGYFNLNFQETKRVGIVYDDPKKIFTGTYTHFHKTYFLCKSTNSSKEKCCRINKPVFRIGCVLIIYKNVIPEGTVRLLANASYQLVPWVFGTSTFDHLKTFNEQFPINSHDFLITRIHKTLKTYSFTAEKICLWQSGPEIKEKVIKDARTFLDNMKDLIGADLTFEEIDELVKSPAGNRDRGVRPLTAQERVAMEAMAVNRPPRDPDQRAPRRHGYDGWESI